MKEVEFNKAKKIFEEKDRALSKNPDYLELMNKFLGKCGCLRDLDKEVIQDIIILLADMLSAEECLDYKVTNVDKFAENLLAFARLRYRMSIGEFQAGDDELGDLLVGQSFEFDGGYQTHFGLIVCGK